MKKLARAAALPVLVALLSACATPPGGGNLGVGASSGLTQGQKKEVGEMLEAWKEKEVAIQKKAREALKELERSPEVAFDGAELKKILDELVMLDALDDDVLEALPPPEKWGSVEKEKVREELGKLVEVTGRDEDEIKSLVELALSEERERELEERELELKHSKFIRRATFKFELGNVTRISSTKKYLKGIFVESQYKKGTKITLPSNKEAVNFRYVVENPAGLNIDDLDTIKNKIEKIPHLDRESASLRLDHGRTRSEIPVHKVSLYTGIGDPVDVGYDVVIGCTYAGSIKLKVTNPTNKNYRIFNSKGERLKKDKKAPFFLDEQLKEGKESVSYNVSLKGRLEGDRCKPNDVTSSLNFVMITPKSGKTVAQYILVHVTEGKSQKDPRSRFSQGKPACPPSVGHWKPEVGIAMKKELMALHQTTCAPS